MARSDILLLCATDVEAHDLRSSLVGREKVSHAGKTLVRGRLHGQHCRLVSTGIGAVNAAHALTWQVEVQRPLLVLQFGVAGAYVPAGLPVGAVACATEEIYGDLGVLTPEGWQPADLIGIPLARGDPPRFNRFPLDQGLVARAAAACGARTGPFVTVAQCSGIQSAGDAFHRRFGALCESMEGAAAAHVCALYGVPFLEVRGVSNLVEDRDLSRWDIPGGARAAQQAALQMIERIDEVLGG